MDSKQKVALFAAAIVTMVIIFFQQQKYDEALRLRKEKQQHQQAQQKIKSLNEPLAGFSQTKDVSNVSGQEITKSYSKIQNIVSNKVQNTEKIKVEDIVVRTKEFEAIFSNKGASLKKYTLNGYHRTSKRKTPLTLLDKIENNSASIILKRIGKDNSFATAVYRIVKRPSEQTGARQLIMEAIRNGWKVTKIFTFAEEEPTVTNKKDLQFGFTVNIIVKNITKNIRPFTWEITALSGFIPDDTDSRYGLCQVIVGRDGANKDADMVTSTAFSAISKKQIENKEDGVNEPAIKLTKSNIDWVGMKGRFFTAILNIEDFNISKEITEQSISLDPKKTSYARDNGLLGFIKSQPYSAKINWSSRESSEFSIRPQSTREIKFSFYGGPADEDFLAFQPAYNNVVSYSYVGFFEPISKILIKFLKLIATYIPNYGFAIIVMTLIIKTLLHGLTKKSLASGHKMQKLQPMLKKLKAQHKDNPKKVQEETMKLWREHGVSQMGSCFPMLIQIPIFISLFGVFSRTFVIRQATFIPGWIDDLSQPEKLLNFGFSIPFIGSYLNLLPIIYAGLQLVQQSMTPKSDDPQVSQQQSMMKIMPLFFMFIFYSMPSGLVLYFTISAGYTLVEHWFIRKKLDGDTPTKNAEGKTMAVAGEGFKKK